MRTASSSSLTILILAALACALGCEGKPPAASKQGQPKGQAKTAQVEVEAPSSAEELAGGLEGRAPEVRDPSADERPPAPPWFDAGKIEHAAVLNQSQSQGKIAGGYASAMVLELKPGASSEQCMEMARTALGESISELPEPRAADGRLTLQGETEGYHYTVVCGEAKGKPTMYLSYTAQ